MNLVLYEHLPFLARLKSCLFWNFDDLAQIWLEK